MHLYDGTGDARKMVLKHPIRGFLEGARMLYDEPPSVAPWNACKDAKPAERKTEYEPIQSFARIVSWWRQEHPYEHTGGDLLEKEREAYVSVVDVSGAKFVLRSSTFALDSIRVTSHTNVTDNFLRWVLSSAMRVQGKPWRLLEVLTARAVETPAEKGLYAGLPSLPTLGILLQKLINGPTVQGYVEGLRRFAHALGEYSDVMIDMTFKAAACVTGQARPGRPGERRADDVHGIINVKSRTGLLVGSATAHGEGFEELLSNLLRAVPEEARKYVLFISSDNPKVLASQMERLLENFPSLLALIEDVAHVKIRLFRAEKPTRAAILAGRVATSLFFAPRPPIAGENFRMGTSEIEREEGAAGFAEGMRTPPDDASDLLYEEETNVPTAYRWGFLLGLVAVLTPGDMAKPADKGRSLRDILEAQVDHFGYLRNSSLRRAQLSSDELKRTPCASASVEALHSEWRHWGQGVRRQDRSLLATKCELMIFTKLSQGLLRLWTTSAIQQGCVAGMVGKLLMSDTEAIRILRESEEETLTERERRVETARAGMSGARKGAA